MGMDPVSLALISSAVASAGAGIYGAASNNSTNSANLNAAQQRNAQIQSYMNPMLQTGTNPFAQSIMNFIGQGQNLGTNANSFHPVGSSGGPLTTTPATPNPVGAAGPSTPGTNAPGTTTPGSDSPSVFDMLPSIGAQFSANGTGAQAPATTPGGASALNPYIPGYTGGFTPAYSNIGGVDISQYLGNGYKMSDLINMGVLTQDQVNQHFNFNPSANTGASPGFQQSLNSTSLDAVLPNNQGAFNTAMNGLQSVSTQATGPTTYLQNGIYYDAGGNPIGTSQPGTSGMTPGAPAGTPRIDPNAPVTEPGVWNGQSLPPGWSSANTGSTTVAGSGSPTGGGMYTYQPQAASTYAASTLGAPPMISGSTAQAPALIGSSQGSNAGQDSLLQMMRSTLQPSNDPSITGNLANISSGNTQFNNSDLFSALNAQSAQQLNQQVGQLHGSAGSLGERFGTAMNQNEALLRSQTQNALNVQNAQIAQTSFENAQNRRLQSLGLASNNQQALNSFNLGAGQQAQQAATTYAGNVQQGQLANQGLLAQLAQFNASNQQSANTANQNVAAQFGLANQGALNTASQFNAAQNTTNNQFTASQGNQYNNLIMQALGMAGNAQSGQNSQNAQLLGILAGLGVPQQQPNQIPGAVSDAASSIGMIPLIQSILGKPATGYSGSSYTAPSMYGNNV